MKACSGVAYRVGFWYDIVSGRLSNFREITNLVESLELIANINNVRGKEIIMVTDNTTCVICVSQG